MEQNLEQRMLEVIQTTVDNYKESSENGWNAERQFYSEQLDHYRTFFLSVTNKNIKLKNWKVSVVERGCKV